jgi:hypothetical protein
MKVTAFIGYVLLGLFQTIAVIAGLVGWTGLHWVITAPLAFFIAYIPVVGSVIAMIGAVNAWHWSWIHAGGLFLGTFVIILFVSLMTHKCLETGGQYEN